VVLAAVGFGFLLAFDFVGSSDFVFSFAAVEVLACSPSLISITSVGFNS